MKRCPRKASSRMIRSKRCCLSSSTFPVWPQIQTFVKKVHQIVFSSHKTKLEGTLLEGKQWWLTSRRQTWYVHSLLFLNCTQQTEFVFFVVSWMNGWRRLNNVNWWMRMKKKTIVIISKVVQISYLRILFLWRIYTFSGKVAWSKRYFMGGILLRKGSFQKFPFSSSKTWNFRI